MNFYFKAILTSTFMLSFLNLLAQTTESIFLERLHTFNLTTTSIQSDFVQTRTLEILDEPLISSGIFYYKKPGLMKWNQELPSPYYFIINGSNVIRFDGKERKVMSSNSPQIAHFKDFILGTIDGSMFESDKYSTSFIKNDNLVRIVLIPQQKSMAKRLEKIELVFEYDKMMLKELVIAEVGGDKTEIIFSNQQINTIKNNAIFN